jgi:methionine-rich copper-binding protein CopC
MRRKIALIMAFTLIFSIVFNMNSGISVTVNALSGGPRLIDSNIRDGDEDVSVHKTFVLTFNIKIEIDASRIKLFNQDSFRMEAVRAGTDGDSTLTIEPRNSMEAFSDYQLILVQDFQHTGTHKPGYLSQRHHC